MCPCLRVQGVFVYGTFQGNVCVTKSGKRGRAERKYMKIHFRSSNNSCGYTQTHLMGLGTPCRKLEVRSRYAEGHPHERGISRLKYWSPVPRALARSAHRIIELKLEILKATEGNRGKLRGDGRSCLELTVTPAGGTPSYGQPVPDAVASTRSLAEGVHTAEGGNRFSYGV